MNEEQWVQSIYSKDAKKWRVAHDGPVRVSQYVVYGDTTQLHYLPKSEYAPCEPPERWVNVTGEMLTAPIPSCFHAGTWGGLYTAPGYRARMVEVNIVERDGKTWVLVLEKKVSS